MDRQTISFEFAYRKVLETILFSGEPAPKESDLIQLANEASLQVNELIHMHHAALAGYLTSSSPIDPDRLMDAANLLADLIQIVQTPTDARLPILPAYIQAEQHILLGDSVPANSSTTLGKVMESVFDRLPAALLVTEMNGKIQYANSAACHLMELSQADLKSRAVQDFIPLDVCQKFRALFEAKGTVQATFQIQLPDGSLSDVVGSGQIIQEADRQKMIVCLIDISAQKRAEEELSDSLENFRIIAERINDIVIIFGSNLRITYVSPAVERILGYRSEDIVGTSGLQVFVPEELERYRRDYVRMVKEADRFTLEPYRIYTTQSSIRWLQPSIRILRDSSGSIFSTISVLRDVTERHNLFLQSRHNEQRYRALFEKSTMPSSC